MTFTFEVLDPKKISPDLKNDCLILVPPQFRCCLEGKEPDGVTNVAILAIVAKSGSTLSALAIVGIYEEIQIAELYSFKICEAYQSKELSKNLLEEAANAAFEKGAIILYYYFRKSTPLSPLFLESLKESCWSEPKLFMMRYLFEAYTFFPPWFQKIAPYPKEYKEFAWKFLEEKEKETLQHEFDQGRFLPIVNPFFKEEAIEKSCSLGLRYKKEIAGWSITHRIAPDVLRYTSLYIKPEHQFEGVSLRLLMDSMKLQKKSPIKWALFELCLENVQKSWLNFVVKRLAPYAIETDPLYSTWKASSPDIFKSPL